MSAVSYRQFTSTAAENYQRFFVPAIATPVSQRLLSAAALQHGERVLDVACGTGVIARHAASRVGTEGTVTAIDIAPDMIAVAKSVPPPDGATIAWRIADAASIPVPDASCDVVLCQMGLMFMEDRGAALSEMHRALAPLGRVAINTPGRIQPLFEVMERALVEHISPDLGGFVSAVFSMCDPDALAALLREAGFRDVSASVGTAGLRLPPPAEFLWQYISLTPMAALIAECPDQTKLALERQFVDGVRGLATTTVDQPIVLATGRA